jgi:hypothetical protein
LVPPESPTFGKLLTLSRRIESAMPLDVLVTIPPKPSKEKRVSEILTWVTERVKATEPDTLNYHSYSTKGDEEGTVDYVVHIRYEENGG